MYVCIYIYIYIYIYIRIRILCKEEVSLDLLETFGTAIFHTKNCQTKNL